MRVLLLFILMATSVYAGSRSCNGPIDRFLTLTFRELHGIKSPLISVDIYGEVIGVAAKGSMLRALGLRDRKALGLLSHFEVVHMTNNKDENSASFKTKDKFKGKGLQVLQSGYLKITKENGMPVSLRLRLTGDRTDEFFINLSNENGKRCKIDSIISIARNAKDDSIMIDESKVFTRNSCLHFYKEAHVHKMYIKFDLDDAVRRCSENEKLYCEKLDKLLTHFPKEMGQRPPFIEGLARDDSNSHLKDLLRVVKNQPKTLRDYDKYFNNDSAYNSFSEYYVGCMNFSISPFSASREEIPEK